MLFNVLADGNVECLYTEEIDLPSVGTLKISRASKVEFDDYSQGWMVTILKTGETLGPYRSRKAALAEEVAFLEDRMSEYGR